MQRHTFIFQCSARSLECVGDIANLIDKEGIQMMLALHISIVPCVWVIRHQSHAKQWKPIYNIRSGLQGVEWMLDLSEENRCKQNSTDYWSILWIFQEHRFEIEDIEWSEFLLYFVIFKSYKKRSVVLCIVPFRTEELKEHFRQILGNGVFVLCERAISLK